MKAVRDGAGELVSKDDRLAGPAEALVAHPLRHVGPFVEAVASVEVGTTTAGRAATPRASSGLREAGSRLVDSPQAIVVIEVREARALVSPAYDDGTLSEADMIRTFWARFAS